jgi:hypothetical protein
MNKTVFVENKDIVKTYTVSNIEISVVNIKLFDSVTLSVFLKDVDNNLIDVQYFTLKNEEYNNWGSNDDYILDFILSKLGLVKRDPPVNENSIIPGSS